MQDEVILPPIIRLSDYEDFASFFEAAYEIFKRDFIQTSPVFRGVKLGLKKFPLVDGKECTFYHMTHEGKNEAERTPDLRRLERIPYPNPMINKSEHADLKVWRNERHGDKRILIFHEKESYLVVLADRGSYILPWTTYYIEYDNRKRKLLEEYEAFKKPKPLS